jgi:hypothetical protein
MGTLIYSFFSLPIHHYSRDEYHKRHNIYVEKEKKRIMGPRDIPFEQRSESDKRSWERIWMWPPWKYNDIVGFLEIGMDIGDHMTADIYLQKKYFPKELLGGRGFEYFKPKEFLYYHEISKKIVRKRDNLAYFENIKRIIEEAESEIRKRNRDMKLFIPDYGMNCFDFVKAHQQLREIRNRKMIEKNSDG